MPVSTATANFLIILLNSFRDKIIYNDPKIRDSFNKLIRENNLKPVVFHSLRHSSTTYKLKLSGGDIKAVQGDTGHSEAAMITERYAHILDDDRRINAEKFEEMFYQQKDDEVSGIKTDELLSIMKKLEESPELLGLLKSLIKETENRIAGLSATRFFYGKKRQKQLFFL